MISGLVLKYLNGECFVIRRGYETALHGSSSFYLTVPPAVLDPEFVVDLLPYLTSTGGYVLDKVEGLAIAEDGTLWVSTDNDGVDGHSGETMLFSVQP
jgi:hypothetical protein